MLFQKRLEGGILLYALFLSAVFTLVLQVYLGRVRANTLLRQEQEAATTAYIMALVSQQKALATSENRTGQLAFNHGQVSYQEEGSDLLVQVTLANERQYDYRFLRPPRSELGSEILVDQEQEANPASPASNFSPPSDPSGQPELGEALVVEESGSESREEVMSDEAD